MNEKTSTFESKILKTYSAETPTSAKLFQRSQTIFPSGVTHQSRDLKPHPIFVNRAEGSHKWDVDGRKYVDYFGGHGALILGHNHPVVQEAVREQVSRGVHYGASHELELEWAEVVKSVIPSNATTAGWETKTVHLLKFGLDFRLLHRCSQVLVLAQP